MIPESEMNWSFTRKLIFRFLFVYILFYTQPWLWIFTSPLGEIPPFTWLLQAQNFVIDGAVNLSNKYIFHVKDQLVLPNGSGDTSYGWASMYFFLVFSLVAALIWSAFDKKRRNYNEANYWLCLTTRYFLAIQALGYGIIKVFALQMFEPNLSQLATPLGDFLPMRLSWLFMGYSTPYQVFSGVMEVIAGLLLLYRRTATAGALLAFGIFMNVAALNLSYDIPVKLFSLHLVAFALFLLMNDWKRISALLLFDKAVDACRLYSYRYTSRKMKWLRIALKVIVIIIAVPLAVYSTYNNKQTVIAGRNTKPAIPVGWYRVVNFVRNGDSVNLNTDSTAWKDIIFDYNAAGSINVKDTAFRIRYGRSYFAYTTDSLHQLQLVSFAGAQPPIAAFRFAFPKRDSLVLYGKRGVDSLIVSLRLEKRHFQLTEKQFHWLSEANR